MGVAGDADFGADVGAYHLQQVELGSHLHQRAALFGRPVELANIAAQRTEYSRRCGGGQGADAVAQGRQRDHVQLAHAVAAAGLDVDQLVAFGGQARVRLGIRAFGKAGNRFKPIHFFHQSPRGCTETEYY